MAGARRKSSQSGNRNGDTTTTTQNGNADASTSTTPHAKKTKIITPNKQQLEKWDGKRRLHFLGPLGTYSHQVAKRLVPLIKERRDGSEIELVPSSGIWHTISEAERRSKATGEVSYALLPYENNTNGPVTESYATLLGATIGTKTTLAIVDEFYLPVNHSLLCSKKTFKELVKDSPDKPNLRKIKKVLSHPQAIGQCKFFIVRRMPKAKEIETFSTGEAAIAIQNEANNEGNELSACIASSLCADKDICDLVVLEENIQNSDANMTRFLLVESAKNKTHRQIETCDIECDVWRMLLRLHTTATHNPISNIALLLENDYDNMQEAHIRNVHREIDKFYKPHDIRDDGISDKHQIRERMQQGEWPYIYLVELECRWKPTRPMPDDGESELESFDDKLPQEVLEEVYRDTIVACNDSRGDTKVHCLGIWPVRIKKKDEDKVDRACMSPTPEISDPDLDAPLESVYAL